MKAAEPVRFAIGASVLGSLLVATTSKGVCAVGLADEEDRLIEELRRNFPEATPSGALPELAAVRDHLEHLDAPLDLALDLRHGTEFQQRVWRALMEVPSGATVSYSALAERVAGPTAVRAVAAACGANLVAVLVPCHRAVAKNGALTGYRWGIERKRALLEREQQTTGGGVQATLPGF